MFCRQWRDFTEKDFLMICINPNDENLKTPLLFFSKNLRFKLESVKKDQFKIECCGKAFILKQQYIGNLDVKRYEGDNAFDECYVEMHPISYGAVCIDFPVNSSELKFSVSNE